MPDHDTLHDYRPDPTFEIVSHLNPDVEVSTDDSGIPKWARSCEGVLDGFHEEFLYRALDSVAIYEPKLYKEQNGEDAPAWTGLEKELQFAIIESLDWDQLVGAVCDYFKDNGKDFPKKAVFEMDPATNDFLTVRPYIARLYALCPNYFHLKDYFLEGKAVYRDDQEDLEPLEAPQPKVFAGFVWFRNFYLNGMFKRLKEHLDKPNEPRLTHKMVGSVELSSDYDVTFGGPDDVPAAVEYFRAFRKGWGVESATLFDANLYVRDWMTVIDQFMPPSPGKQRAAGDAAEADKIDSSVQVAVLEPIGDIYGLVKIRRYTSKREWNALVDAIKRGVKVDGLSNAYVEDPRGIDFLQYEAEPSEIPRFRRLDLVEPIYETQFLKPLLKRCGDIVERFLDQAHDELKAEFEESEARAVHLLLEFDSDGVLRAMTTAYLELAAKLRGMERKIRRTTPGDFKWRQNQGKKVVEKDTGMTLAGFVELTEKASLLMSEMILFANEAYNTQGALWSVVGGQAGAKPENLTVDHFLQSFNEQVGDALKELKEHLAEIEEAAEGDEDEGKEDEGEEGGEKLREGRETATGFYRASKYESRMAVEVDAMVRAFKEDPFVEKRKKTYEKLFPGKRTPDAIDNGLLQKESVMDKFYDKYVAKLLEIRKGAGEYKDKTAEEKEQAAKDTMTEALNDQGFKDLSTDAARNIAKIEYGVAHGEDGDDDDPEKIKYVAGGEGHEWNLRHLTHHLLWHCALVNKLFRKIRSRGPMDLYVVNFAQES